MNICLAAASVVVSFAFAEIIFRVYLFRMTPRLSNEHLNAPVVNATYWEYDEKLGYHYRPNMSADLCVIQDSLPYKTSSVIFDHRGNSGVEVDDANSEFKIFVLGDSFTMIQDDGITWPHLLQQVLRARTGRKVTVLNYSREAYGILQMIDQASMLVDEKPDMILIAFITPDLPRARFWRMKRETATSSPGEKNVDGLSFSRT